MKIQTSVTIGAVVLICKCWSKVYASMKFILLFAFQFVPLVTDFKNYPFKSSIHEE